MMSMVFVMMVQVEPGDAVGIVGIAAGIVGAFRWHCWHGCWHCWGMLLARLACPRHCWTAGTSCLLDHVSPSATSSSSPVILILLVILDNFLPLTYGGCHVSQAKWIVADAQAHGLHHLLVIPCLLATMMLGPTGLVLYFILRTLLASKKAVKLD